MSIVYSYRYTSYIFMAALLDALVTCMHILSFSSLLWSNGWVSGT